MAAYILSPERWRELSAASSPVADGQQQTPQAVGPGIRRRISRVFYEAHHTPVSSPVALNLHHHLPAGGDQMDVAEDEDLAAAAGVIAAHVERFLPQRRSPGQRSQDSGFSGYSGDSASEGSAASSTNSPVPAASGNASSASSAGKRSPLSDPEAAERALLLAEPVGPSRVLETDLDAATPARLHVSRIYIRGTSNSPTESAAAVANLNLRDVLCEKNIQPVNLSGTPESSSTSPDKCVGDKSLISAVLANSQQAATGVHNRNNNNYNYEADRSGDSQTALLLEHKSIVPPSSMRPNLSWKKLSESFRRVISSGRMMSAGSSTTTSQSCLPTVADADESFTDEEKSRMLLLGKRSNLRRIKSEVIEQQQQQHADKEEQEEEEQEGGTSCASRVTILTDSPQPTSRYLGGPRSSTPRKTLPAEGRNHRRTMASSVSTAAVNNINNNNNNNNNKQRHCSRLGGEENRPRVHWADIDPVFNSNENLADGRRKPPQPTRPVNGHLAAVATSWPDNSTWDSDTPSLEIGHQVVTTGGHPPTATPQPTPQPPALPVAGVVAPVEQRKIRRGLRMGVGVDRSLVSTPHARKQPVAPVVPVNQHPIIIPAPAEFRSVLSHPQPSPSGLRWSPVEAWLKDLPMFYQPESTCALQNKAIQQQQQIQLNQQQQQRRVSPASWMTDDSSSSADGSSQLLSLHHQSDDEDRTYSMTVTARAQVRRLQRRAHLISTEFAQLCSFIELYEESKLVSLIPLFLAHVIQFIREAELAVLSDCGETETNRTEGSEELIHSLRQTCTQLVQIVTFSTRPLYMMMSEPALMLDAEIEPAQLPLPVNWSLARQITAKLGQVFVSIVDTFVGREIEVLTAALKSGKCVSAAKLAANSLMSLGSDAARPALRPLIEAFQVVHLRPVRADLLRALAALCSSADIIQEFETCGGLAVVFDVLCNPRSQADSEEKSEAAGLLAQITSPWLDPPMEDAQAGICGTSNGDLQPNPNGGWPTLHLTPYISSFIAALTELSSRTETEETLLLSTAALANLTFSHSEAVQLMAKYRTAQVLVQATSFRKELSVFIQDQIATILANMAAVYSARAELVSHGALVTLVSFLQLRPSPMQRPAEVTASERVLKKSAIALSRVCGEENAARQIVDLEGIERLAQLVRDPRERNYSDGVLVACLAALHKIATACGTDEVGRRGASDLIENRLLDVFLEYSSRPESYV